MLPFSTKLIERIPDASNTKEYYQSYLRKKNKKLMNRSKIIAEQPKTMENLNIVDINQLLQNTQKLLINYPRLLGRLKRLVLTVLYW